MFADHPVRDGNVSFDFKGFGRTLAELALNPDNRTPFTVVVKGEWGRGKTTLLEETRRLLNEEGEENRARELGHRRVRTLWFNAWKYPQEDTVLAGLLGALLDELRRGKLTDQIKIFLDAYKNNLPQKILPAAIARVLGAAASWVFEGIQGGEGAKGGEGDRKDVKGGEGGKKKDAVFESRFSEVEEKRAFHDHFRELFGQVSYVWFHGGAAFRDNFDKSPWSLNEGRDAVVAVFLDDLDRCKEDRVLAVLEAINLFLDLPGVCFYLGLDWQRLSRILENRIELAQQEKFLEKIVQVAFDLPEVAEEGAEEFISGLITDTPLAGILEGQVKVVAEVLKSRNPRHAKRFLNDLSIRLGVLRNTGHLLDVGAGSSSSKEEAKKEVRLPIEAVLAWHLLLESLSEETRRNLTVSRGNLVAFLTRYRSVREKTGKEGEAPIEEGERTAADLLKKEGMVAHMERLLVLSPPQRDLLVHLGSPPRIEPAVAAVPPTPSKPFDMGPDSPWWVPIPGGEFMMGSKGGGEEERPIHPVRLSPFKISRYPVTNAQYAQFVADRKVKPPDGWKDGRPPEGKEAHPVVNVSWDEAAAFCAWLSKEIKRPVHLPTEAQWEFAARGKNGREYPWGSEEPTQDHANFGRNVGDTTPVDSYPKGVTPEGIHDLAGNVWEWCHDWNAPYQEKGGAPVENPTGPPSGTGRVVRGGSWDVKPRYLRSAFRYFYAPTYRYDFIGLRCAQDQ